MHSAIIKFFLKKLSLGGLKVKYRGKSERFWISGSLVVTTLGTCYIVPDALGTPLNYYLVDKNSVGRYVGIKDKYGHDVYEGQQVQYTRIVYSDSKHTNISTIEETIIGEIYYSEGIWLGIRCTDGTERIFLPGTISPLRPNLEIEIIEENLYEKAIEGLG